MNKTIITIRPSGEQGFVLTNSRTGEENTFPVLLKCYEQCIWEGLQGESEAVEINVDKSIEQFAPIVSLELAIPYVDQQAGALLYQRFSSAGEYQPLRFAFIEETTENDQYLKCFRDRSNSDKMHILPELQVA